MIPFVTSISRIYTDNVGDYSSVEFLELKCDPPLVT